MTHPQTSQGDLAPRAPIILVIDDGEANREVLKILLRRENFGYLMAEDGKSGIDLARSESPNLILLDLFMPEEDGFEILERLKRDPGTKDIPVVIFTVLERPESKKKALDMGACAYITKPFDMREIISYIKNTLGGETECQS